MSDNIGKDVSVKQEERIAKLFKGSRTPQSGGGKWKLGDIHTADWLIECKTTVEPKLTYSIKKTVLDKAKQEAQAMGKKSAILAFTLGENFNDYFVVDTTFIKEYIRLVDAINQLKSTTQHQIKLIEARAAQLLEAQRGGGYEISELDKASFKIHKNRLTDFLESLNEII